MDMKRFFLYFIVIAALALAGCGGNGGTTAMMPPDPPPTPPTPPTCTGDQVLNADQTACVDPPAPPREAPPMALVHGIVTANDRDHSATNPAPYSSDERPGKDVTTDGDRDGDVVLLGSLDSDSSPVNQNDERVKTDGTIGDVSIAEVDVASAGAAETFSNTRKLTMTDAMAPSVGRFASGSVHERTHMGVTDTVYVYETRDAPGPRAWNMHYSSTASDARGSDNLTAISGIAEATSVPTGSQGFNVLTFATDVTASAKSFASDRFPSGGTQTYTYHTATVYDALAATAKGASDIRGREFDGMFDGIPGTYTCAATGADNSCTATTNNRGQIVGLAGTGATWTFKPNNLATGVTGHMVQGVVNDTDYLTFGYWVQKDVDEDETTIGVSTFASGTPLIGAEYTLAAMALLEGTADYEGKAVGKFVLKTLTPQGVGTVTDGGTFTADANLKAYFGGNAISFNDKFSISGTIDGFRNDDGDMIDSNWSVTLRKANFATDYDPTAASPTKDTPGVAFTGVTSAGGPAGDWGGSFYGAPRTSTGAIDVPTATNTDAYPTSVAGEFDAHFTNGHALGAFGAELD